VEQIKKQAITIHCEDSQLVLQTKAMAQPARFGFLEPKHWFYKKILVQFNQLIPCSY